MNPSPSPPPAARSTWQQFSAAALRLFHAYASWLVSISWRRFAVLSVLLFIIVSIIEELPPFRWQRTELVSETPRARPVPPRAPVRVEKPKPADSPSEGVDISIDERGVRITPREKLAASAPDAAAAQAASEAGSGIEIRLPSVSISLPPGADSNEVRDAVKNAKEEIAQAIRDANEAAREAAREQADAAREAADAAREAAEDTDTGPRWRTHTVQVADFLSDLAFLWIIGSALIKITYKGRLKAEAQAAQATEVAESESLKRQVVEARMAAMQAQVEPHFLFNTLASIDHLIETDPPRASKMQRNLISLLRASMPTMREANAGGLRDLGRELSVIRPYLEILKVRMEERLQTRIEVPEGLHSAEFPPMMVQSLVENAIKHGLEPKAEGGELLVRAEILHGKLAVTVADTGLGFGKAATAGTGVGLANIRERLQLLYGAKGSVTVAENRPSGTIVTITVPYAARTEGVTA
jgi:signal transduction histidine kinase